jgi:hypothetical protein
MDDDLKAELNLLTNAFLAKEESGSPFSLFINSLNDEEKQAYFRFEALRAKTFIEELNILGDYEVDSVDELAELLISNRVPIGHDRNLEMIKGMIEIYSICSKMETSSDSTKMNVIEKYGKYIREMTIQEKEFLLKN